MTSESPKGQNPFANPSSTILLDGGLATALEDSGHDLNDPLWSAKVLLENPQAIKDVHRAYLEAGADIISTATYQASLPGFARRGLTEEQGADLLRLAVELALSARDEFWDRQENRENRCRPLVAASIGPYGAYLADGSEYRGQYEATPEHLRDFHESRWEILLDSGPDLLACETLPSLPEVMVLLQLLRDHPGSGAWFSFCCGDKKNLWDGTPVKEAAKACGQEPRVWAVGVNCTAPCLVSSLMEDLATATDQPVIVYPNLGQRYDAQSKTWGSVPDPGAWLDMAGSWAAQGAAAIGGCCQVGPELIGRLRESRRGF